VVREIALGDGQADLGCGDLLVHLQQLLAGQVCLVSPLVLAPLITAEGGAERCLGIQHRGRRARGTAKSPDGAAYVGTPERRACRGRKTDL
jgi:hypothetical protein